MTAYLLAIGAVRNDKLLLDATAHMFERDLEAQVVYVDDIETVSNAILDGKPFEARRHNSNSTVEIRGDEVSAVIATKRIFGNRDGVVGALKASGDYEQLTGRYQIDRGRLNFV